jgi:hypothetical protein
MLRGKTDTGLLRRHILAGIRRTRAQRVSRDLVEAAFESWEEVWKWCVENRVRWAVEHTQVESLKRAIHIFIDDREEAEVMNGVCQRCKQFKERVRVLRVRPSAEMWDGRPGRDFPEPGEETLAQVCAECVTPEELRRFLRPGAMLVIEHAVERVQRLIREAVRARNKAAEETARRTLDGLYYAQGVMQFESGAEYIRSTEQAARRLHNGWV